MPRAKKVTKAPFEVFQHFIFQKNSFSPKDPLSFLIARTLTKIDSLLFLSHRRVANLATFGLLKKNLDKIAECRNNRSL